MSIIMPLFYMAVFSPPIEWFPDEIIAIRQARVELVLQEIIEVSKRASVQ
jgi:hypothetical protein